LGGAEVDLCAERLAGFGGGRSFRQAIEPVQRATVEVRDGDHQSFVRPTKEDDSVRKSPHYGAADFVRPHVVFKQRQAVRLAADVVERVLELGEISAPSPARRSSYHKAASSASACASGSTR
jgi:hypothetical protein